MKFNNKDIRKNVKNKVFGLAVIINAINGIFETIGGAFLLFVSSSYTIELLKKMVSHELQYDPSDFFANKVLTVTQTFSLTTQHFIGLVIFTHGLINLWIVLTIWKKKIWAFPIAVTALLLLAVYQIYRFSYTGSIALFASIVIDLIIVYFTADKYIEEKENTF